MLTLYGRITQWLECYPHTIEVPGSNPGTPTEWGVGAEHSSALFVFELKKWIEFARLKFMKNKTYNIITIGCQMNKSDSERAAAYLEKNGYRLADDRKQAGLVIVNTCGVRQSAEDRVYGLIPRIKKENLNAKIILTGCLIGRQDVKKRLQDKVDVWLPIKNLPKLGEILKVESPSNASLYDRRDYLSIVPKYNSKVSAFVPIGNGCDNFCAYCVVPFARGREVYRSVRDVIKEVKELVENGYKEIILIAQNVNSYKDNQANLNFAELLGKVNDISGDFWIRFATSHPKDMGDELIKAIAECDKVCGHVHLPAQAGDNEILKKMNRNYTIEHYKNLIRKIRRVIPGASITTDIIVGFPGETRQQFENTVKLFRAVKFDMAYIARYSPRPGTAAFKMENNVSSAEKKKREEELTKILEKTAAQNNQKYLDKIVDVLVFGKNKKGEWFGRPRTDKNVILGFGGGSMDLTGKFVKAKIISVKGFGLKGKLVE